MSSADPAHALLLGRLAQEGDTPLALLPVSGGPRGDGALAVSSTRLWLTQPHLLGGPSVASVPLTSVGAVRVEATRGLLGTGGGLRVELVVDGRPVRWRTRASREAADDFAAAVAAARRAGP
ncbi:hypothetical protein GTR02_10025 [Kineococcus sp. R8]|uniref:hypothetical protein n=1 Tax=Kineococcus siccus TaxID=2696567 RepID=UPI0014132F9F|nr:hypothetical protein [Kineococcus siccus]NAZ82154.1 hypothetical protein [Kineococcus siccus]